MQALRVMEELKGMWCTLENRECDGEPPNRAEIAGVGGFTFVNYCSCKTM